MQIAKICQYFKTLQDFRKITSEIQYNKNIKYYLLSIPCPFKPTGVPCPCGAPENEHMSPRGFEFQNLWFDSKMSVICLLDKIVRYDREGEFCIYLIVPLPYEFLNTGFVYQTVIYLIGKFQNCI